MWPDVPALLVGDEAHGLNPAVAESAAVAVQPGGEYLDAVHFDDLVGEVAAGGEAEADLDGAGDGLVAAGAAVVVSLTGTRGDPQGRDAQADALHRAGASVWLSNAAASLEAARLATTRTAL